MGIAVIPGHDTSPPLQPAECIFNKIPLLIQRVVKGKCFISSFSGWHADRHPLWLSKIHATTLRRSLRLLETYCYRGGGAGGWLPLVVADQPFSQQKQDGTPMPVTNNMEFGIQATFCSTDETWQACHHAVSLEMGGVDHQGAIKRCFICQLNENFIENTEPAPPDKAIVQRFVGPYSSGASCH